MIQLVIVTEGGIFFQRFWKHNQSFPSHQDLFSLSNIDVDGDRRKDHVKDTNSKTLFNYVRLLLNTLSDNKTCSFEPKM